MMGLHASFTLSDETLEKCVGIARTPASAATSTWRRMPPTGKTPSRNMGCRPCSACTRMGVSGEKSLFIHCVHIDEAEMDLIAATKTAVVHNPESNMNNAVGVTAAVPAAEKRRTGRPRHRRHVLGHARADALRLPAAPPRQPRSTRGLHGSAATAAAEQRRDLRAPVRLAPWRDRGRASCRSGHSGLSTRPPRSARPTSSAISSSAWWMQPWTPPSARARS